MSDVDPAGNLFAADQVNTQSLAGRHMGAGLKKISAAYSLILYPECLQSTGKYPFTQHSLPLERTYGGWRFRLPISHLQAGLAISTSVRAYVGHKHKPVQAS